VVGGGRGGGGVTLGPLDTAHSSIVTAMSHCAACFDRYTAPTHSSPLRTVSLIFSYSRTELVHSIQFNGEISNCNFTLEH
jgi:hypothetical protein